jgi:hypothetical protein
VRECCTVADDKNYLVVKLGELLSRCKIAVVAQKRAQFKSVDVEQDTRRLVGDKRWRQVCPRGGGDVTVCVCVCVCVCVSCMLLSALPISTTRRPCLHCRACSRTSSSRATRRHSATGACGTLI